MRKKDIDRFILQIKFISIRNGFKKAKFIKKKKIFKKIGNNVSFTTTILPAEPFLISIGNNVIISAGVRLITHSMESAIFNIEENSNKYLCKFGEIIIGNNVYIGANVLVLPGVKIGNNVVIGAGAVITKNIADNSVVAGVPAHFICSYEDLKSKNLKFSEQFTNYKGKNIVLDMYNYLKNMEGNREK